MLDGLPLPNERIRVLGYYSIEIQSVQETDAGVYTCSLPDWPDVTAAGATLSVLGKFSLKSVCKFFCTFFVVISELKLF